MHYLTHRAVDVGIGVVTGLAVNLLPFLPLQLRPAEYAVRHWGQDIAAALRDLATLTASPGSPGQFWPRYDRGLTTAAERARVAARQARESLRWNPRAAVPRSVPRLDGAGNRDPRVVTARTRGIARLLICGEERQGPAPFPSSFGQDYAQLLRALADLVCELADLGSPRAEQDLIEARSHQRQLEDRAGQLSADVRHLVRLTSDMIGELAGDTAAS